MACILFVVRLCYGIDQDQEEEGAPGVSIILSADHTTTQRSTQPCSNLTSISTDHIDHDTMTSIVTPSTSPTTQKYLTRSASTTPPPKEHDSACPGCGKHFPSERSLGVHKARWCPILLKTGGEVLKNRTVKNSDADQGEIQVEQTANEGEKTISQTDVHSISSLWTDEHDALLIDLKMKNTNVENIAKSMDRTVSAVTKRILKLRREGVQFPGSEEVQFCFRAPEGIEPSNAARCVRDNVVRVHTTHALYRRRFFEGTRWQRGSF